MSLTNLKVCRVHGSPVLTQATTVVHNHINEVKIATLTATYTNTLYLTNPHTSESLTVGAILHSAFSCPELEITWDSANARWALPPGEYNIDVRVYGDAESATSTTGIYKLVSSNGVEDQTHEYIFPMVGNPLHLSLMAAITVPSGGGWLAVVGENTGDGVLNTNSGTKIRIVRIR